MASSQEMQVYLREAAKKVIFLVVGPLTGGGGKKFSEAWKKPLVVGPLFFICGFPKGLLKYNITE